MPGPTAPQSERKLGSIDMSPYCGQSAGATIVGGVLAAPEAAGLFHRAIVRSSRGLGAFTIEQAARVTRAAAEALGAEPHVDAFAEISDDRLVGVASRLVGSDLQTRTHHDPLIGLSPFSLVLDTQSAASVTAGLSADADLLIGANTEEGHLHLVPVDKYATSTTEDIDDAAARSHPDPARLVEPYRRTRPEASSHERTRFACRGVVRAPRQDGARTQNS